MHKGEHVVRRSLSILGAAAGITPLLIALLPAATANAHGYVEGPASRQAQCAQGIVSCGAISYEPQSAEGPKGQRNCHGGNSTYAELSDDSKPWQVHNVGSTAAFTWKFTANHRTDNWEYYIGDTRVGLVDGNNEQPPQSVTHTIDLSKFSGKQKLLAIWNIGDTVNAFYSCVDLNIGSGGGTPTTTTAPTTTAAPTTTTAPTTTKPPTTTRVPSTTTKPPTPTTTHEHPSTTTAPTTTNPPAANEWQVNAEYAIGDVVTYQGVRYRCLQAHKVYDPNWMPSATPALWQRL